MADNIKHTCKDCIHFKICNDYVYLIGREDKVACPDFKSTYDVVPRSEYDDLKMQFTELDIECDRLENVEKQLDKIKQKSADFYCSFTQSKIQNCPIQDEIAKAKQEVAEQICDLIKQFFEAHCYLEKPKEVTIENLHIEFLKKYRFECCEVERFIAEIEKKYKGA